MVRPHLNNPHGREAIFAECGARSEERGVVIPPKRRATLQRARKGASRLDFGAQAQNTSLRALPMAIGVRRDSRLGCEPERQNAAHEDC